MNYDSLLLEVRKMFGRDHKFSETTREFVDLLASKVDTLTEAEQEDLFVVFSAFEATRRLEREGVHYPVSRFPGAKSEAQPPAWVDHGFKTKGEDDKERFHSDRYGLSERALRELVALLDEGWSVSVDARDSSYYPGITLRVTVAKASHKP